MRIAHTADWHIRLLKRHKEYRKVFKGFKDSLIKNEIDLIVVAGDVFHNKTSLSPEAMNLATDIFSELSEDFDIHIIPGNHDCIVNLPGRLDAISPVLRHTPNKSNNNLFLYKNSGLFYDEKHKICFGVFCINDEANFPVEIKERIEDYTYIALFHGALDKAVTDVHYVLNTRYTCNMFKEYDLALLGDIHKHQVLLNDVSNFPRVVYPGALIQQNFGESLEKGYVIWDLDKKTCDFERMENDHGYYTMKISKDDDVDSVIRNISDMPKFPSIRVFIESSRYNQVTLRNIASTIKEIYNPTTLSIEVDSETIINDLEFGDLKVEDVSQLHVQQKLLRDWFAAYDVTNVELEKIMNMHSNFFYSNVEDEEQIHRGTKWSVDNMKFSNTFSYGKDNSIDFNNLKGLVGIFSPNKTGKSALLTTLLNGLFNLSDRVSRRNLAELINFKENSASINIELSVDNKRFRIDREIEKYDVERNKGQSKVQLVDITDDEVLLSGESTKNETERILRNMIGSFNDHSMITFGMQDKLTSFIDLNQSLRKETLSRFLGIDVIDNLFSTIKTECDSLSKLIQQYKNHDFTSILSAYTEQKSKVEKEIESSEALKTEISKEVNNVRNNISSMQETLFNIDGVEYSEEEILKSVGSFKEAIKENKEKISDLVSREKIYKESNSGLKLQLESFDKSEIDEFISKLNNNREMLQAVRNSIILLKKDIKNASRMAGNLEKHDWFESNELCKKCSFLSDAFGAKKSLENYTLQIEEKQIEEERAKEKTDRYENAEERLRDYQAIVTEIESNRRKLELNTIEIESHRNKLNGNKIELSLFEELQKRYKRNKEQIEHNSVTKELIEKQRSGLSVFEGQLSKVDKMINTKNSELGTILQKINDLDDSIKELVKIEEQFRLASLLKDALSKDGIPLQIIEQVIPRINAELVKILSNVVDFGIIFEIDKESKDIDIYIDDGDCVRSISLGSGMERTISSIALRAAIANISLIPSCNLFIIDEGFGTLDSDNLNNMNMMLGYLKSTFDTVIVISHIQEMQDICDYIISIERDENGYSKLKIGA